MANDGSSQQIELLRNIFEMFSSFKDAKDFTDVVVVVEEKEFPCHRVILAAVSGFFKGAMTSDMKEGREGRITLHGVTEDVFSALLTSIYELKNVLTDDNLFDIWAAADILQVRFIIAQCVVKCKEVFDSRLSTKNCVEYLTKVSLLDQTARRRVLEFTGSHFSDLDVQIKVSLLRVDDLKSLLTLKELKLHSEDEVIECALKWAVNNQVSASQEETTEQDTSDSESATSASILADVLECSRYLLITEGCLHGTLATNPLVKSDPRCQSILEKISCYQALPHLHQTWCPPAAVHRENSGMANVLVVCQFSNPGQLQALDLSDMTWKQITLYNTDTVEFDSPNANVLCHKSEIYVLYNNQLNKHFPKFEKGQFIPFSNGIIRVAYDSLYVYSKDEEGNQQIARAKWFNFPAIFSNGKREYKDLGCFGEGSIHGKKIADVIYIGTTEVIFCVGDVGSYTIITADETYKQYYTYPNQLGSSSRLVTFRNDKDAFVLQENGRLWRLQVDDVLDVKITQELVLWYGEVSLNGAVLYNDQLVIVGNFLSQSEVLTTVDRSLPGVFLGVMIIKSCCTGDNGWPNITLAELPKNVLERMIDQ
ncbi:hypothetical protein RRG08_015484 [Elysia crispata]|uniref:BTB domain-containing protein n=1 Tax=Elysia crispata TaxID=231223 RepID=A0AAE1A3J7_9GAST|nr:hypothetical protein RRG08_015484 [Elysia crispata]